MHVLYRMSSWYCLRKPSIGAPFLRRSTYPCPSLPGIGWPPMHNPWIIRNITGLALSGSVGITFSYKLLGWERMGGRDKKLKSFHSILQWCNSSFLRYLDHISLPLTNCSHIPTQPTCTCSWKSCLPFLSKHDVVFCHNPNFATHPQIDWFPTRV